MKTIDVFRREVDLVEYVAGHVIYTETQPGQVMYAVLEGEVELLRNGEVVETVAAGEFFGELALVDRRARNMAAVARTPCKLARIDEKRFLFLVQQAPFLALQVMRVMVDRLRRL